MADAELVLLDRWCAGDAAAGNELFRGHFEAIYRFFDSKLDREPDDLVQETFLACVRNRDAFQRHSSFRTYVFAIARNLLYRFWRDRSAQPATIDFEEISLVALTTTIGTQLVRREEQVSLHQALDSLPVEQQLLLELHYWEELDADQLAEVFDTAPATSRSRLFRARQALRAVLGTERDHASVDPRTRRLRDGLAAADDAVE